MSAPPSEATSIADAAGIAERFTDYSIEDPGVRRIFARDSHWQSWLDVEAALAVAEADLGIVPRDAATRIVEVAHVDRLDRDRVLDAMREQGHPLVPLIDELVRVAGPSAGGWVHWGATSQNIMQSGMALLLERAHAVVADQLDETIDALADLAERSADMLMPGRTHGQHAVPITFGLKAATWIDDLLGARERIDRGVRPCLRIMMGGAVGNFAALGADGPAVQDGVARRLGLSPMMVPSRAILAPQAGYVADLAVLAASCARIALDVETMMQTEFGEVSEPVPEGSIGSSTMPHKRNPKLATDILDLSARVRAMAPEALAAVVHPHEADGGSTAKLDAAMTESLIAMGDLLARLRLVVVGLELFPDRMRQNLALSGDMLASEAVMIALGTHIGRDAAHHLVYGLAMRAASSGEDFARLLRDDDRVAGALSESELSALLDPVRSVGLSPQLARETARRARRIVG